MSDQIGGDFVGAVDRDVDLAFAERDERDRELAALRSVRGDVAHRDDLLAAATRSPTRSTAQRAVVPVPSPMQVPSRT